MNINKGNSQFFQNASILEDYGVKMRNNPLDIEFCMEKI